MSDEIKDESIGVTDEAEDYGSDYITIADEDGNEFELELLDTFEFEGSSYSVFLPAEIDTMDVDDPDYGLIILLTEEEDGEAFYSSVDDEAQLQRVYEHYMQMVDEAEAEETEKSDTE